jgi:hypothetical protein
MSEATLRLRGGNPMVKHNYDETDAPPDWEMVRLPPAHVLAHCKLVDFATTYHFHS